MLLRLEDVVHRVKLESLRLLFIYLQIQGLSEDDRRVAVLHLYSLILSTCTESKLCVEKIF